MTPDEAQDLAARTLAAINLPWPNHYAATEAARAADRERVESDLAGVRDHEGEGSGRYACQTCWSSPCSDALRYAANLRRTAALYGVTP